MSERAHQVPLLPFIPSHYPDEVLGSWLSRIRIENGGGAWRAFLEHVGYGRRLQNVLFDVVDHNKNLSLMLTFLGMNYEQALLELSTLPYWLTFSASDSSSRISGTTTIPTVQMTAGGKGEISSIRNLGSQRSLGKSFEPRYCPKCISQDFDEVGQSYWHRAHQLPNVLFCHKHYCKLTVKCPACGIKLGVQSKQMLPLPTSRCQCGFRLETISNSKILSPQELRLIDISVRALNQSPPSWQRNDVLSYLRVQLARGAPSSLGQYQRVLSEAFPASTINLRNDRDADRDEVELRFRPYLSNASAPECCGLLAALDIDFDIAIAGFKALATKIVPRVSLPRTQADTMTVENSRAEVCRFHQLYPKRPISCSRRHYWYLRLYDAIWLQEQFPKIDNAPIPTIAEDRAQLEKILSSVNTLGPNTRLVARNSPAGLRATIRDREWFSEQKSNSKHQMAAEKMNTNISILSKRASTMQIALEKILSSEERPIRVHASTLGALVGLSTSQAESVVRSNPALREAITAANADKLRRQILWAARQLPLLKGRLSKKQLGRVAGVPTVQVSDEIFAEVKALHYRGILR